MSREHVEAFYQRLASDEAFKQLFQSVKSKEECSQLVKEHGYEFTQQEWEDYTANLLESVDDETLVDLEEKELEAVIGGFVPMTIAPVALYGIFPTNQLPDWFSTWTPKDRQ